MNNQEENIELLLENFCKKCNFKLKIHIFNRTEKEIKIICPEKLTLNLNETDGSILSILCRVREKARALDLNYDKIWSEIMCTNIDPFEIIKKYFNIVSFSPKECQLCQHNK